MNDIAKAVRILRSGGLVAFPTRDRLRPQAPMRPTPTAVLRIFAAKGRPATNPLIVHVATEEIAKRYAAAWPDTAATTARGKFAFGPLTIVVQKSPAIPPAVTAGGPTVGLRSPDHPLAMELLLAWGGPIAAPSANRSTWASASTMADRVRAELAGSVNLILDGGPCRVGIESTVLDLSRQTPTLLRPGSITRKQIEAEIGPTAIFEGSVTPDSPANSPGQHAVHYAPRLPAYRFAPMMPPASPALARRPSAGNRGNAPHRPRHRCHDRTPRPARDGDAAFAPGLRAESLRNPSRRG